MWRLVCAGILAVSAAAPAAASPGKKSVFTGCGAPSPAREEPLPLPEPAVGISRDRPPALPPLLEGPAPASVTVTVRNRGSATLKTHLEVSFCRFGGACDTKGARVLGSGGVWPMGPGDERVAVVTSKPLDWGTWVVHVALVQDSAVLDRWSGRIRVGEPKLVLEGVRTPGRGGSAPWDGGPVTLDVLVGNQGNAPDQAQVAFVVSSVLGVSSCVTEIYAAPVEIPAGATRVPVAVTWQPPLGGPKSVTVRLFDAGGQERGVSVANRFSLSLDAGAQVQSDVRCPPAHVAR